jgi:transposase
LTEEIAIERLKWAHNHLHWGPQQWRQVIWSDKCSVEKGAGKETEWVFRTPQQKYYPWAIQEYNKSKGIRFMIFAAYSGAGGRSECHLMQRDQDAPHGGYSAKSYITVLDATLEELWQPYSLFLQDNARIHTAQLTMQWFEDNGVQLLKLPPYSPDLNTIEHLWPHLKKQLYVIAPELDNLPARSVEARNLLAEALPQAWNAIDGRIFETCWISMKDRCQAVIDAGGWQTRY